jgi:hypothetical protein
MNSSSINIAYTYGVIVDVIRRFEVATVVTESIGSNKTSDRAGVFRHNPQCDFYPVIDKAITELNVRFSEENMKILRVFQASTSGMENFFNSVGLAPLASNCKGQHR